MAYSTNTKILSQLKSLSQLALNNPNNKLVVQNLLQKAFDDEKPLFSVADKSQAAVHMKKAIPIFDRAFMDIHGSMNPDLRQSAQIWRSGLQFLVDEFKTDETSYNNLKQLLESDSVQCVEEYIVDSQDISPEFSDISPINLINIPKEHYWWFHK